jgi:hypothetical protein
MITSTSARERQKFTIVSDGDDLRVTGPNGTGYVRYVELEREIEGLDEKEQPRITAELHLRIDKVPATQWIKLAFLCTHDSLDGEYAVALENAHVYEPAVAAMTEIIGDAPTTISMIAKHTNARDSLRALAEALSEGDIGTIDGFEIVDESGPVDRGRKR